MYAYLAYVFPVSISTRRTASVRLCHDVTDFTRVFPSDAFVHVTQLPSYRFQTEDHVAIEKRKRALFENGNRSLMADFVETKCNNVLYSWKNRSSQRLSVFRTVLWISIDFERHSTLCNRIKFYMYIVLHDLIKLKLCNRNYVCKFEHLGLVCCWLDSNE